MTERPDLIYMYDGTFEGLLSAVFDAYELKEQPLVIDVEENLQTRLTETVRSIETNGQKAERVRAGIIKKLGFLLYEKVWCAFLSNRPDKATEITCYLRLGFSLGVRGRELANRLTDPHVMAVDKMSRLVSKEAHLLKGFTRFNEMSGGAYYAAITPDHNVLPLLMPHFVDRFGSAYPFVLHDKGRGIAGLYGGKGWYIADAANIQPPSFGPEEAHYTELWLRFYHTIGIKERHNPRCKRSMCPKKFWPNMVEMRELREL